MQSHLATPAHPTQAGQRRHNRGCYTYTNPTGYKKKFACKGKNVFSDSLNKTTKKRQFRMKLSFFISLPYTF